MGADLILAHVIYDKDTEFDWDAGLTALRGLDIATVAKRVEDAQGDLPELDSEIREEAENILAAFKEEMAEATRDAITYEVGDKILELRGGTSWGDDPSEGFTAFSNIGHFPEVLRAIGFTVEPDR